MRAIEKAAVKLARKRLSLDLYAKMNQEVRYGPFKGMSLVRDTNCSKSSLGAKVAGIFEQSLLTEIIQFAPFRDVVDFGAADGYYPLGFVKAGMAERGICFEITSEGRSSIRKNAENNGVSEKIVIEGIADAKARRRLSELEYEPKGSLVICDIEGGEHDLFTEEFFSFLNDATIVIELHDMVLGKGTAIRDDLVKRIHPGRKYWIHQALPVNWVGVPEIEALSGNDRALVCSEGRKCRGEWLVVLPVDRQEDTQA